MKIRKGPYTVKEVAQKKEKTEKTILEWVLGNPEEHDLEVEWKERIDGTYKIIIWEITEVEPSELIQNDFENLPVNQRFEILLYLKVLEKTTTQRTSMRKYYRDIYNKTGVIPKGIFFREGRKASGRGRILSETIVKRFIEMVKKSANDVNHPDFITKKLRTIVNFHRRLEDEFGKDKIPLDALYRLVPKYGLKKHLKKSDYDDLKPDKIYCFKSEVVFSLIQVDGCEFDYIEIRDENGKWKRPHVIEFFDTGSRYMIALDVYFSESSENSIDIFLKFLRATPFPQKRIHLRPDEAGGFKNLKRPIHELNQKYSLLKKGFIMYPDFARPRKPEDKPHLESSHRRLHGFEDFIILKLPRDKFVERVASMKKIGNKFEKITINRFDISLKELRNTGLIKQYQREQNEKLHVFSESGKQQKWIPKEKFEKYLSNVETFKFKKSDIEDCLKYGFSKENASVSNDGKIRFQNANYYVVNADFYEGSKKNIKVKVSQNGNKLYIFKFDEDGICLGEAMLVGEYENTSHVEKKIDKKLKLNEFEKLTAYLEKHNIVIKGESLVRLMDLHKQGLNIDTAEEIIKLHKQKYNSYLNNPKYKKLPLGPILCNLFFAHYTEYERIKKLKQKNHVIR